MSKLDEAVREAAQRETGCYADHNEDCLDCYALELRIRALLAGPVADWVEQEAEDQYEHSVDFAVSRLRALSPEAGR